ncbi:hypothetical protein DICVIV_10388 [Dictyocaulus viviparus]|uniref:G-protein coupled receptors family 1 profile domain-containing protein n=1 Tax=Dictyocaulus viviparus TaxID=29172 RepID=A0A0D8XIJ5_DICVI|nr:hypothetical protein DICVIV_10388 [Dictyocaulus viviparus]
MYPDVVPFVYRIFYIVIPTIALLGNNLIIYVTVRSDIEDHQLPHDLCVYLQLLPLFGVYFSNELFLNVALDRLLSLQKFYIVVISYYSIGINKKHKKLYTGSLILPAFLYALFMASWIFIDRRPHEMVVCVITAPMIDILYELFVKNTIIINILIIVCYCLFIFFLKNIRLHDDSATNVYRSLMIVSLSVILGSFSTMIINLIATSFQINIERIYINLLAGIFVNTSSALNIIIYYTMSKQYRRVFDKYLYIGYMKRKFTNSGNGSAAIPTFVINS